MQYALVRGIRSEPLKGEKGICEGCHSEVIAKCGSIKIHHWAHRNIQDCDSWYEPETEWHRDWKNCFPIEYREVPLTNPLTNERHRADIHTAKGVTIEFQNSPISVDERRSRDEFYERIIWVVNGAKFKDNFRLICNIPNPTSPLLNDFSIANLPKGAIVSKDGKDTLRLFRKPAHEFDFDADRELRVGDIEEIYELMDKSEPIYWLFDWKYKQVLWFSSKAHVFFDFGDEHLYWLKSKVQHRAPSPLWYVHFVKKVDFIKKYSSL
jgi:hypothetical protein